MISITHQEFLRYLEGYGTAVHCELYANNYTRYQRSDETRYYYDRGCAILARDSDYQQKRWIWRAIHQVSPDADIAAMAKEQLADAKKTAESYTSATLDVIAFTVTNGDLTPEQNTHYGWRNFVRPGYPSPQDPAVRILTEEDLETVKAACAPSLAPDGDTNWGRQLAKVFTSFSFENRPEITLWGIFEGDTLAGVATTSYPKALNLAWLMDVFVFPAYRKKGFGKRLVLSALSLYPDTKWHYQVARDNTPSIALARSLGFTLEGAGLYL